MNPEMNYLAVVVGGLVSVAIGALWYSKALFGKAWVAAIGKTEEQVRQDFKATKILWAFVLGFFISYGIARLIVWTGMNTPGGGFLIGLLAAITFVGASMKVNDLFEGRPCKLFWITWPHHLVELLVIGMILGAWT